MEAPAQRRWVHESLGHTDAELVDRLTEPDRGLLAWKGPWVEHVLSQALQDEGRAGHARRSRLQGRDVGGSELYRDHLACHGVRIRRADPRVVVQNYRRSSA